jgi:Alpha-glutamyl/putrescinyl thymine pyrophosphorylase clade 2
MTEWLQFGRRLFSTEDADPMYYALARAELPIDQKERFMVGWVTYYQPGIAATASEKNDKAFWGYLRSVYAAAPRASERRHFRGQAGEKALREWQRHFPYPEEMVRYMRGETYFHVKETAKDVPQIGPYFVWKFADVQERVFRIPCDFTGAEKFSPKVPQEGAKLISQTATTKQVYDLIIRHMSDMKSPPWYDRPINMQEAETVCCVFHQYVGGGYTWMSRTAKAAKRLLAYPCDTSDALLEALMNDRGIGIPAVNKTAIRQWVDRVLGTE